MNQLNGFLLALIVVCGWSVVSSSYKARQQYIELESAQKKMQDLETRYGQLLLEQSTFGSHEYIENKASAELKMHAPDLNLIVVLGQKEGRK